MNKDLWLQVAEAIDTFRVFPRMLIMGYAYFVWSVTFYVLKWYATQPAEGRGPEESAVVGVVITAVTGFAPWLFRIYSENGRDWNSFQPTTTTSTVLATKTTKTDT